MGLSMKKIEMLDKNLIKKYIDEGKSYKEIAKMLNTDRHNIGYIAKNILGITHKFDSKQGKSDDEIRKLYNELLNSSLSLEKFCKSKNMDRGTFSQRCKVLNLHIENNCNKRNINEAAFDVINEESAYWLGFLLADGHVDYKYRIELSLKDKEHVEKFRAFLNSDHKVTKRVVKSNGAVVYRICIRNKYISERLIHLGIIPRKTYNPLIISNEIYNSNYIRDFVRGFFDGDGHIKVRQNKKSNTLETTITSYSEQNLNILKDVIYNKLSINPNRLYHQEKRAPYIIYNVNNSNKFLKWIYEDSSIYLDRKYQTYIENCRLE